MFLVVTLGAVVLAVAIVVTGGGPRLWHLPPSSRAQIEAHGRLAGVWKVLTVDTEKEVEYDRSLIELSVGRSGRLVAAHVDLRPSSLVSADRGDVSYADGILECELPEWGGGGTTFRGSVGGDCARITELTDDRYRKVWVRTEDRAAISFMRRLEESLGSSRGRVYQYAPPPDLENGLATAHLSEVGIEEGLVSELVSRVLRGKYDDIHDLLIVKDDRLVLEEYFRSNGRAYGPFLSDAFRNRLHLMASGTKSITSILVGIAIGEGFIADVDVPVFDLLPEYGHLREEGKEEIHLRHLLTMTAGLEWRQSNEDPGDVNGMWGTDDVVAYYLAKPVVAEPGTEFTYSNGVSTTLGAAVGSASGLVADEFAERYLFAPLGIRDFDWARYQDGTVDSDGGLALRPRDLAKIGQMLLDDGRWGDRKVVPEEWIVESTKGHVEHPGRRSYGYQWWRTEFEVEGRPIASYHAWGWGGQYLFVFPDLEMIVVSNAGNFEYRSERHLFKMIESHILPAAFSSF